MSEPTSTGGCTPLTGTTLLAGTVERFDEAEGLGTVRADDGAAYLFHCTQIADGTRSIPVGVPVEFHLIPGRNGRWEAAEVRGRA